MTLSNLLLQKYQHLLSCFLIGFICSVSIAQGQSNNTSPTNFRILKISPLALANFSFSSIELTYEFGNGNPFSTQITGAYILPKGVLDIGSDVPPNHKGFRVSIAEKYFFDKAAPSDFFIGLELNYANNENVDTWGFSPIEGYNTPALSNTYADTFLIKKQTFDINALWGYQVVKKHFVVEFYVGIGLRYRVVRHFDRIHPEDYMHKPRHPNYHYLANKEGANWALHIPVNVRLGYKL